MSSPTKSDVLLSIDSAMMALATARRVIESYEEEPVTDDGQCKHQRQDETFGGRVCLDCGAEWLVGDAEPEVVAVGDGVPSSDPQS